MKDHPHTHAVRNTVRSMLRKSRSIAGNGGEENTGASSVPVSSESHYFGSEDNPTHSGPTRRRFRSRSRNPHRQSIAKDNSGLPYQYEGYASGGGTLGSSMSQYYSHQPGRNSIISSNAGGTQAPSSSWSQRFFSHVRHRSRAGEDLSSDLESPPAPLRSRLFGRRKQQKPQSSSTTMMNMSCRPSDLSFSPPPEDGSGKHRRAQGEFAPIQHSSSFAARHQLNPTSHYHPRLAHRNLEESVVAFDQTDGRPLDDSEEGDSFCDHPSPPNNFRRIVPAPPRHSRTMDVPKSTRYNNEHHPKRSDWATPTQIRTPNTDSTHATCSPHGERTAEEDESFSNEGAGLQQQQQQQQPQHHHHHGGTPSSAAYEESSQKWFNGGGSPSDSRPCPTSSQRPRKAVPHFESELPSTGRVVEENRRKDVMSRYPENAAQKRTTLTTNLEYVAGRSQPVPRIHEERPEDEHYVDDDDDDADEQEGEDAFAESPVLKNRSRNFVVRRVSTSKGGEDQIPIPPAAQSRPESRMGKSRGNTTTFAPAARNPPDRLHEDKRLGEDMIRHSNGGDPPIPIVLPPHRGGRCLLTARGTPYDLTQFFNPLPWDPERYKYVRRLAPAIHGEVKYVLDLKLKKSMVVKVIRNSAVRPREPGELENPLVEIGAMTFLHSAKALHPVDLVARLEGVFQDKDFTYLVTEYCEEGELFKEVVTRKSLDERHVKAIALQLALALHSLHLNGICHRDVSLENTLIQSDRSVRLIDFGQAETIYDMEGNPKLMTGSAGKAYYRAPEMLRGSYYGPPADVFALGVEIFIMAVGSPPWQRATKLDARYRNLTKCPTALDVALRKWEKRAGLSDAFVDILASIFCSEPADRPTIEDLLYHPWFAFDSRIWRWVYVKGCSRTIRAHADRVEAYLKTHPHGKFFVKPCSTSNLSDENASSSNRAVEYHYHHSPPPPPPTAHQQQQPPPVQQW